MAIPVNPKQKPAQEHLAKHVQGQRQGPDYTLADFWRAHDRKPDDLVATSPVPCDFKLGDRVVFTNDYGVSFDLVVRGFAAEPHNADRPDWPQRFVYVFTDAWWFPTSPEKLKHRDEVMA